VRGEKGAPLARRGGTQSAALARASGTSGDENTEVLGLLNSMDSLSSLLLYLLKPTTRRSPLFYLGEKRNDCASRVVRPRANASGRCLSGHRRRRRHHLEAVRRGDGAHPSGKVRVCGSHRIPNRHVAECQTNVGRQPAKGRLTARPERLQSEPGPNSAASRRRQPATGRRRRAGGAAATVCGDPFHRRGGAREAAAGRGAGTEATERGRSGDASQKRGCAPPPHGVPTEGRARVAAGRDPQCPPFVTALTPAPRPHPHPNPCVFTRTCALAATLVRPISRSFARQWQVLVSSHRRHHRDRRRHRRRRRRRHRHNSHSRSRR